MHRLILNKKGLFFSFILVTTLFVVFGCAFTQKIYYRLKEGYITEVSDSYVVVCLGQKSGVWVGEELNVYDVITVTRPKQAPLYKKMYKGRIRITEITGDYHSKAIVVSGQVRENYQAELSKS